MIWKKIIGITALAIGLFVFILYTTIKTKSRSLDRYEPFKKWVGKTVVLHRETVLFREKNPGKMYPYLLADSLHPEWQYTQDRKNLPEPELIEIMKFAAGTKFKIEKAVQFTNGVSGSSSPTVFGIISKEGKTYKISYQWGKMDIAKFFDHIEQCWQFHQAPWQDKTDTAFYALPEAEWW